jgi:hypothetical protein
VKNKSETVTNISQNPHCNHKPIPIPGNPPTCTEDGSTEGAYCPLCGEMLKKIEVIPATGHRFSDWQIAKPASCTEDGEHARTCHCGARETKKIPARGTHIPGQWTTAKEATEYAEGLKVKKCIVCGEQVASESIPKKQTASRPQMSALSSDHASVNKSASSGTIASTASKASQGLTYTVNADGKTCSVTGQGTCKDKEIVIPEEINGYKVTEIITETTDSSGCYTSGFDKAIKSVNIPDSVTRIGYAAFKGCKSLASIRYDGTKKQWEKISLGSYWKLNSAIRKVECTDGSIKI